MRCILMASLLLGGCELGKATEFELLPPPDTSVAKHTSDVALGCMALMDTCIDEGPAADSAPKQFKIEICRSCDDYAVDCNYERKACLSRMGLAVENGWISERFYLMTCKFQVNACVELTRSVAGIKTDMKVSNTYHTRK